jgi:hypothetical protein
MKLNVLERFEYYLNGVSPTVFEPGEQDVPAPACDYALAAGLAEAVEEKKKKKDV